MKKIILLFALLFSVSTAFISCRDTTTTEEPIEEGIDEAGDAIDETADEIDEEI